MHAAQPPQGELVAALDAGPDSDAEETTQLTQRLQSELLDLDVETVEPAVGGEAPEGAKGAELLALGGLVIRFALDGNVLRSIVHTTAAWLGRQQSRSVSLTLDGDALELTGISSEDQSRLIEMWLARHATDV
jgi:hypothetical protein